MGRELHVKQLLKMPRLKLLLPFFVGLFWTSSCQDQINITGPLEGHVNGSIRFSCSAASPLMSGGISLIYRNGSMFSMFSVTSSSNEEKGFIISLVTAALNGTEIACAFSEFNSIFLPILIFSSPVLEGGVNSNSLSFQLREGESLMVNNSVRGYPYPDVAITREGGAVGEAISVTTEILVIRNINRADAGIYTLTFSNSEGTATITVNLTVYYPPTFSTNVASDDIICDSSSSVARCRALTTSNGSLICNFDSVPSGTLTFGLPPGSRATPSSSERTITVRNARPQDSGTYNCTVNNTVFMRTRTFILKVGSLPAVVADLTVSMSDMTVTVSWTYNNQDNSISVRGFNVSVQAASSSELVYTQTTDTGTERAHDIPKSVFMEDVEYQITVFAENVLGMGEGRGILFVVPVAPVITTSSGASLSLWSVFSNLLMIFPLLFSYMM